MYEYAEATEYHWKFEANPMAYLIHAVEDIGDRLTPGTSTNGVILDMVLSHANIIREYKNGDGYVLSDSAIESIAVHVLLLLSILAKTGVDMGQVFDDTIRIVLASVRHDRALTEVMDTFPTKSG